MKNTTWFSVPKETHITRVGVNGVMVDVVPGLVLLNGVPCDPPVIAKAGDRIDFDLDMWERLATSGPKT